MTANVLLVDDEPGIRKVLKIYLTDAGFTVDTADNGEKAVKKMENRFFDILLTDIRMPGMDGISLLKHVKKVRPETEVIMITAHGEYHLAIESLKLDAVDFIAKPIDSDALSIALKRALDRIESRRKIEKYTQNLERLVREKTKRLEESQKRYLQLFHESPSYITIQDEDLNIVETNRIFERDFKYEKGAACYEVYKGRGYPCPDCPVIKTFKDGKTHTVEMDFVLKDSSVRNMIVQTSAVTDAHGEIRHVMEMSTDVTMIRELQDHLAALGLHIGSISHSLKQVLTGIDGGSYLLESGLAKDDGELISEGWEIVKQRLAKTRQMVLDILYHTKKRRLDRKKTDLAGLVQDVVSNVKPADPENKIAVQISIPPETAVFVDKNVIVPAISGVLENAYDACRNNPCPKIEISAAANPPFVLLSVKDNGKGLTRVQRDKIFDLFYSDKGSKGTGLGLFIAMRAVKQHGGNITVDSRPGKSTIFQITLPIK